MIYGDLNTTELRDLAPATIAVLPIAAVEQHGRHLPVITDTALVTEIASRAERALTDKVMLLPTLWAGSSHHHFGFAGTLSIGSETYIRVLMDLVESLEKTGFRRIVLLNGHGGNIAPANEALYRIALQEKGDKWVTCATYWTLAGKELAEQKFMETPRLTHACEYETSMMLALRADWVKMDQATGQRVERRSKFYDPLGYNPSRVSVSETFRQMTNSGAMGSPEKAKAEKGELLFQVITNTLTEFLKEFSTWELPRGADSSSR